MAAFPTAHAHLNILVNLIECIVMYTLYIHTHCQHQLRDCLRNITPSNFHQMYNTFQDMISTIFGRPLQVTVRPICYGTAILSLCVSVTLVYCGQTVEWIKMPLGTG